MNDPRLRKSSARWLHSVGLTATIAAFAPGALAQAAKVDIDEHRTTPVGHRYIHGELGDAKFQMALPDNWNGKLLIGARGFSGDENSSGAFKTVGLQKGYAYALSDPTVSPGETAVYKRLVEARLGSRARDFLAVYYFPGMGHGGAEYDASLSAQLDALEKWVDWHQSGGRAGSLPPNVLAGVPRD